MTSVLFTLGRCVTLRGPSLLENHARLSGVLRDGTPHAARLDTLGGPEHGLGSAAGLGKGALGDRIRSRPLGHASSAGFLPRGEEGEERRGPPSEE